ncbi:MAG: gamma-glutamylcyclotransferase family protein [Pseudomonadota bacterium]
MTDVNRLFVYGSLQPGAANAHKLDHLGGNWSAGAVNGRLLDRGWGARMGFPGLILGQHEGFVAGQVLSSDKLADAWPALDAFEGAEYERVLTEVRLVDDSRCEAYVYVLKNAQEPS